MTALAIDWRASNHADVLFNDEEVWALSLIDAEHPSFLRGSLSIAEKEMLCQRDMRVRGRRLWSYHERVGDLFDFIPPNAAVVRDGKIIGHAHVDWDALSPEMAVIQ